MYVKDTPTGSVTSSTTIVAKNKLPKWHKDSFYSLFEGDIFFLILQQHQQLSLCHQLTLFKIFLVLVFPLLVTKFSVGVKNGSQV